MTDAELLNEMNADTPVVNAPASVLEMPDDLPVDPSTIEIQTKKKRFPNIRLMRERLVCWGRFLDQTIDFKGGDVLITGVNTSGKSIMLDSIKMGYIMDSKFNLAANKASGKKKSDRTVLSYIHGDRRAESKSEGVLRPDMVESYILLEYYNPETDKTMIIGQCFESANMEHLSDVLFYYDDAVLEDFTLTRINDKGKKEYVPFADVLLKGTPFSEYRDRSGEPYYTRDNKKKNKILSSRLGFKCDITELRRVVSAISAFSVSDLSGAGGVSGFCQKYILPEKELKCISALVGLNKELADVQDQMKGFEVKRDKMRNVINAIESYKKADVENRTYALIIKHHEIEGLNREIVRLTDEVKAFEHKIGLLAKEIPALEKARDIAVKKYYDAINNDAYRSFESLEKSCVEAVEDASAKLRRLGAEKEDLKQLSDKLAKDLRWFVDMAEDKELRRVAEIMTDENNDMSEPATKSIQKLDTLKRPVLDDLRAQEAEARLERDVCQKEHAEVVQNLIKLQNGELRFVNGKSGGKDIDMAQMRQLLSEEIFKRRNERVEIRIFAELIEELKEASTWRKAVESYLGANRFSLIVLDQSKLNVALDVFRELKKETSAKYRGIERCRIVYTDLVRSKTSEAVNEGSAAALLVTKSKDARLYANYLLNHVHLCKDYKELKEHAAEGGLMSNGASSKGCTEGSIYLVDNYCLGASALQMQRIECEREECALKNRIRELDKQIDGIRSRISLLENVSFRIDDYNFRAPTEYKQGEKEREDAIRKLDSVRNDPDFVKAMQAKTIPEQNKKDAEMRLEEAMDRKSQAEQRKSGTEARLEEKTGLLERARKQYDDFREKNPDVAEGIKSKYVAVIRSKEGISEERGIELAQACGDAKIEMQQVQSDFSAAYPEYKGIIGDTAIAIYNKGIYDLENGDITNCLDKIEALRNEMNRRYREDYIKELADYFKSAYRYIRNFNKNLDAPFGKDRYELVLKPKDEYAPVFNECKRYSEGLLADTESRDEDFLEYVRDMVEKITNKEMSEEDYADYRKYFDIRLNIYQFDGGKEIKYDFQMKWGSASGGEMNTPLIILLAASLLPLYEKGSARLILLDEAFPDISDDRIRPLMDFLKSNNFQTIYCTHNGAGVLGMYVDTLIGCYPVSDMPYSYVEQMHEYRNED